MLWHTSIAAQRLTPRGEVAMTCAGRPGFPTGNFHVYGLGRVRG